MFESVTAVLEYSNSRTPGRKLQNLMAVPGYEPHDTYGRPLISVRYVNLRVVGKYQNRIDNLLVSKSLTPDETLEALGSEEGFWLSEAFPSGGTTAAIRGSRVTTLKNGKKVWVTFSDNTDFKGLILALGSGIDAPEQIPAYGPGLYLKVTR